MEEEDGQEGRMEGWKEGKTSELVASTMSTVLVRKKSVDA